MMTVHVKHAADFEGWRMQARWLLATEVKPALVTWQISGASSDLFANGEENADEAKGDEAKGCEPVNSPTAVSKYKVPRKFVTMAEHVVCHSEPSRFALLYRVLWRMTHGEHDLLQRVTDDDVYTLMGFAKAVARDRHKMTAFVRFRKTPGCEREHFSAWFEPSHHILRLTSDFFCKRFSSMDWSIYTPEGSAHWNQAELVFGPPGTRRDIPDGEIMEQLWCTYFSNIFNPARLRLNAMRAEMPVKYWKNLPEAPIIAKLTSEAGPRASSMVAAAPSRESRFTKAALPARSISVSMPHSIDGLRETARHCDLCEHACDATQTVFGQGPEAARVMIVGEQPGDIEDVRGKPFVGPSGKLLRAILSDLSVDPDQIYFTNAVKHFKYKIRGKRRLHQRPSVGNVEHCRTWLLEELSLIKPEIVVALGSTAARSLLGRAVRLGEERGVLQKFGETATLMVSHHPARLLRGSTAVERKQFKEELIDDLAMALSQSESVWPELLTVS